MQSENNKLYRCSLRGKFKKDFSLKKNKLTTYDVAVLGDWVLFDEGTKGLGVITKIINRKNYISRKAKRLLGRLKRGERMEQIIASNLDAIYIVASVRLPEFNNRFLDRVLVAAESCGVDAKIIINKIDLDERKFGAEWEQFYTNLGYKIFITSVTENIGIEEVKKTLKGNVSLFWGQSGVGKSSLLNTLFPQLNFSVGEISEASLKGKHTTVTGIMEEVDVDTFIVDTPGIRAIEPYGIKKEDLSHYFIEFESFIRECKFNTCIHEHEPGCAIVKAVEEEKISIERYESYLNILSTIEEDMFY